MLATEKTSVFCFFCCRQNFRSNDVTTNRNRNRLAYMDDRSTVWSLSNSFLIRFLFRFNLQSTCHAQVEFVMRVWIGECRAMARYALNRIRNDHSDNEYIAWMITIRAASVHFMQLLHKFRVKCATSKGKAE